jgi:hypothetical protein
MKKVTTTRFNIRPEVGRRDRKRGVGRGLCRWRKLDFPVSCGLRAAILCLSTKKWKTRKWKIDVYNNLTMSVIRAAE